MDLREFFCRFISVSYFITSEMFYSEIFCIKYGDRVHY